MMRALLTMLGVAAVGTLISFLAAGWISDLRRDRLREDARAELSAGAEAMATALDDGMYARWVTIQAMARDDAPAEDEAALRGRRTLYNGLKGRERDWAWIGFARPDGTVLASTDGILEGVSVAERPWFGRGSERPSVLDVHEARLLARYLGGDPASPPRLVDITAPVRDAGGALRGVLGSHLSWSWAKGVERALRSERAELAGTEVLIVGREGDVLLAPPGTERRLLIPGVTWTETGGRLSVLAPTRGRDGYPGLGWSVVLRRSDAVVMEPAESLRRLVLGIGFGLAAFLALGAFWVAKPAPRPAEPARRPQALWR